MNYNKIMLFCSVLIATILSSGCGIYFGPGLANTAAQLENPAYRDEDTSANYVSAQAGSGNRFGYGNRNFNGGLSFHRANTYKYGSVTYGAFGYLGNFHVGRTFSSPDLAGGNKFYGGLGLMAGGNFHVPFKRVDWEIFKLTTRFYNELGAYPRFKRELIAFDREGNFTDLYVNHGRMVDMIFGTGWKIKHKNRSTTRIDIGVNAHIFGDSCNDISSCQQEEIGIGGWIFQAGYSFAERISLNFRLSTGSIYDDSTSGEVHPITNFGISYRL